MNRTRVVSIGFNPVTGEVLRGFGATVAVVTPSQVWDVTLDPETAGSYDEETQDEFIPAAFVRSATGAAARGFVMDRSGSALRVSCVDPATGAAANAAAVVFLTIDRVALSLG